MYFNGSNMKEKWKIVSLNSLHEDSVVTQNGNGNNKLK